MEMNGMRPTFGSTVSFTPGRLLGGGEHCLVRLGYLDTGLPGCRWGGDIKVGQKEWPLVE